MHDALDLTKLANTKGDTGNRRRRSRAREQALLWEADHWCGPKHPSIPNRAWARGLTDPVIIADEEDIQAVVETLRSDYLTTGPKATPPLSSPLGEVGAFCPRVVGLSCFESNFP